MNDRKRNMLSQKDFRKLGDWVLANRGEVEKMLPEAIAAVTTVPVVGTALPSASTSRITGWGDSMVDFNLRRTVFSVGLSLVEW